MLTRVMQQHVLSATLLICIFATWEILGSYSYVKKILESGNSSETSGSRYQLTRRHTTEHLNIKLRYVFLLFGMYHSFKSIIIRNKIQRLEEMMIMTTTTTTTTTTLATHTKCSDLQAYEL
jgi:hypothetical protein